MGKLEGKVAIVVGASGVNNMGYATARRFAAEGAKVLVAGRREEPLRALAAEIGGAAEPCDLTQPEDIARLVGHAIDRYGRVDIGVNAAGWGLYKPFLETSFEDLQELTRLQFIGPFLFFQALVKAMAHGGSIIEISTVSIVARCDFHAAYSGTKAGIDHVITCIANDFGGRGIRANIISPGFTDTPMAAPFMENPAVVCAFNRETPLNRPGTPDDIANAALWLASDESAYVTGMNIQVNGGLFLRRLPNMAEIAAAFGRTE